jgi:tellurite resistance protein TerC
VPQGLDWSRPAPPRHTAHRPYTWSVEVSPWAWFASFIVIAMVLGAGALLLRTRWATHRLFTLSWIGTAVFLALAFSVISVTVGLDEDSALLGEYVQESAFVLDTVLAFSVILRRYLPESARPTAALLGVATTIVVRASFISVVNPILQVATWLLLFIGFFLVHKGWIILRSGHKEEDEKERSESWMKRQIGRWRRTAVKYGVAYLPPMVMAVVFLTFADPVAWPDGGSTYPIIMANALALLPVPVLVRYAEKIIKVIDDLPYGVGIVAGFIGIKFVLSSLNNNTLPFLNGGVGLSMVPTIGTILFIFVTVFAIGIPITFSLFRYRKARRRAAVASAVVVAGGELKGFSAGIRPVDRSCDSRLFTGCVRGWRTSRSSGVGWVFRRPEGGSDAVSRRPRRRQDAPRGWPCRR